MDKLVFGPGVVLIISMLAALEAALTLTIVFQVLEKQRLIQLNTLHQLKA